MKESLKKYKILVFISLFFFVLNDDPPSPANDDDCEDDEIPIKQAHSIDRCQKITDVLDNADFSIGFNDLRGMVSSLDGETIVNKNNYILEFFNLEDLSVKGKKKLYIPQSCFKLMENNAKIKLKQNRGIAILVSNKNKVNKNKLPEVYFIIRHDEETPSEIKYMNSKTFDFNFCHDDPILLNQTVSINDLRYDTNDDTPINIERIMYAKKKKIDLFDPHSDFLNDICFKFTSENNTDVTMETRMTDYYQDITLCDEKNSAHYIEFSYDNLNKKLSYICAYGFYENMEEKSSYIDNIDSKMNLVFSNSNLKVITCFRELFELKNLWHNYGGFICIFVFIVQVVLYIDYCCKGINNLVDKINQIFKEAKMDVKIEKPGKENADTNVNTNNNLVDNATSADKLGNQDINVNANAVKTTDNNNIKTDEPLDETPDKPKKAGKKKKKKKKKENSSNPPGKKKPKRIIKDDGDEDDDENDDDESQNDPDEDTQDKEENEENGKKKGKKGKKKKGKKKKKEDEEKGKKKKGKKKKKKKKKKDKEKLKIEDVNEKDEVSSTVSQIYELNDDEKNELVYEKAVKNDLRNFCQYYCFMVQISNILLNTFCRRNDYNLFSVKFALLLMTFPINLTFNAFFFTSKQIQSVYLNKIDNISIDWKNLLHSFASSIISSVILIMLKCLCLTHSKIRALRKIKSVEEAKKKSIWLIKCIKLKIFIYYALSLVFLLIFGYYVMCFCTIFENTQLSLMTSMFTSWALSLLYPFGICFVTAIFRRCSLRFKKKCCYKINHFLQMI